MTAVNELTRTAESAAAVVAGFFDRYRAHDVEGMTDLCAVTAGFSYLPVEVWGKQRVLRGDGTVGTVGKPLWAGLIASFPDLSNTVRTISSNGDGDVVAEVDIEGTQQLAWGLIAPAGRHYSEPHLFIFHVGTDLLIDRITAYWNDAGISQQLGHTEVD
jgi:ketosteroid isomerase-like protein